MKRRLLVIAFVFATITLNAQEVTKQEISSLKKQALIDLKSTPEKELTEYYKTFHPRVFEQEILDKSILRKKEPSTETNLIKSPLEVPQDMIYPGEFEEVQAILMTWPYITKTVQGNSYAQQLFDGYGQTYTSDNLVQVYSVPDVSNTAFVNIFRNLADAIQDNAEVWINIWSAEDSTAIIEDMEAKGRPLSNYRFFVNPGNSFWYRDCGPVCFYYGQEDSIGFMDFEYYGGRPLDDLVAKNLAQQAGYRAFTNTIELEGGNVLVDGLRTLITSSAVYALNRDSYGRYIQDETMPQGFYIERKDPLSEQEVRDSLSHLMNLERCIVLPRLYYDGGTGHVDLYVDLYDESTFISTKHPEEMASFSDPRKVESNMDSLVSLMANSPYANGYYNRRIPFPRKDNGSWYTSQSEYHQNYTRSYSNHLFVNKSIVQPKYCNGVTGDNEGFAEDLKQLQNAYHGYDFKPIDVREFDGYGGAIHCITKQIPAENPLRIYHYPIRWLNTTDQNSETVWLTALCQNKSGIENVELLYRTKGQNEWNTIQMNVYDGNIYDASLPINPSLNSDTIEYYISATSNNGKTMTKPIVAPEGYYTFIYGTGVEGNSDYIGLDRVEDIASLKGNQFYPNPAQTVSRIDIPDGLKTDMDIKLINLKGQVLAKGKILKGQSQFEINTSNMKSGNYWVIFGDNTDVVIKKLVVVK